MNKGKSSPGLLTGILVALFCFISFSFRCFLPYDQVFSGDWIKFTSIDAYYHMLAVDNLVHNFPSLTSFAPFLIYPGGAVIGGVHFFDWLLSGIIWVIGLGSPTQHTIDVIGVYFPVVLAALTVIPVYFIGKALFNRWAGLLAAALVAVLPGEYLGRSILGFTDHHVAETLFSTVTILFLILALREAGQRGLAFSHLLKRDLSVLGRPLLYSLLAGLFLGIYLITWSGGLLFVFIISLYLIVQFIISHLRRQATDHLGIIGSLLFLIAALIFLPLSVETYYSVALVIAFFIPLVLWGGSRLISGWGLRPVYYPLGMVAVGVVFIGVFFTVNSEMLGLMVSAFSIFAPVGASATTTLEMQPFLSPQGSFSTLVAWGNFTTSFFLVRGWPVPGLALISFIIIIWLFVKRRGDDQHWLLFIIWTLIVLVATLGQRRFAYYLVVNIALLSAYLSWQVIWLSGLSRLVAERKQVAEEALKASVKAKKPKRQRGGGITIYHVNTVLVIIVVFIVVFLFNIIKSQEVASKAQFAPADAWQECLTWVKENTPEPLGDPDAYYGLYEKGYKYPESAYGVTSWWDYGYWISRTAHRIPSANPSQAPEPIRKVAGFFLSDEEALAGEAMAELGSAYIMADYAMATSKFWAIVTWAGKEQSDFTTVYYLPYEGKLMRVQAFRPEYYRTMLVRLYNFNGEAVADEKPVVVSYDEKIDDDGNRYRQVTGIEECSSYQEALDFIDSQESGNHSIVGVNPFVSPIPLKAVQDYKLVYSSSSGISNQDVGMIPEVKVLEYLGD